MGEQQNILSFILAPIKIASSLVVAWFNIIATGLIVGWCAISLVIYFFLALPLPNLKHLASLRDIRNANPNYQFEDNNFQKLVNEYNKPYDKKDWNISYYYSNCEMFAPNWEKVNKCISRYSFCESQLPLRKYDEKNNHNSAPPYNPINAFNIYWDARENPLKYPEYTTCVNTEDTKKTIREYMIITAKLLYGLPIFVIGVFIELTFGEDAARDVINFLGFTSVND